MTTENTYIKILQDVLSKKIVLLEELKKLGYIQEESIKDSSCSPITIQEYLDQKEGLLRRLDELDEGFELLYQRVSEELKDKKEQYRSEIEQMQQLIKRITDNTVELQVLERRLKREMTLVFQQKRNEVKTYHTSNQMVSNYYKNMSGKHQGQSYFYDKKK